MTSARPRYPEQRRIRPVLVPCVLGVIVLLATLPLIRTGSFVVVQYVVAILALVVLVMTVQRGRWWWGLLMLPIAGWYQPVFPIPVPALVWQLAAFAASVLFLVVGVVVRVLEPARGAPRSSR